MDDSFRPPGQLQKQLQCKRMPPQMLVMPTQQGPQIVGSMFPPVGPEMHCSEFAPVVAPIEV